MKSKRFNGNPDSHDQSHDDASRLMARQPTGDPRIDYPGRTRFLGVTYGGRPQPDGTRTPLTFALRDRWGEHGEQPCHNYPDCDRLRDELLGITPAASVDPDLIEMLGGVTPR